MVTIVCILALVGACAMRSIPLVIGVCLAYVAFTLQVASRGPTCPEMFSVKAVDNPYERPATAPSAYTPLEPGVAKVAKTMTKEQLQAMISPEHLESAQSNRV
jgi:hypothetical protein